MTNLIGQSLGRYHILEQLGEGGMAVVFKAFDMRLEAEVAVKVIRTERLVPEIAKKTLKRFEREAKSLAQLTHPNIVKVIDYGSHEGNPYLVMEYLPGGTLKSQMGGHPIPYAESARTLLPIARALEYAHSQGMIHRDIKPSNILITQSGEPMLSDFGIAKLLDPDAASDLTGTGTGIGTPEYMAPEQVTGTDVDQRADVYSLGIVLYEMVTGRKPYTADTPMAVLFKHASEPLPRPKSYVPNLPDQVERVLIKALAKRPEDRYAEMEDFVGALEKLSRDNVSYQPERKSKPLSASGSTSTESRLGTIKVPETRSDTPVLTVVGKKLGWGFFTLWFLGGVLGTFAGGFVGEPDITPAMFPIMGLMLGVAQWLLLRVKIPRAGWWILATFLSWTLLSLPAFGLNEVGYYDFCGDVRVSGNNVRVSQRGDSLIGRLDGDSFSWYGYDVCSNDFWILSQSFTVLGLGGVVGGAQWLVLRRKIKWAGIWITINIASWSLGVIPITVAFGKGYGEGYFWIAGIIYAILSAWGMVWLLNTDLEEKQRESAG